MSHEPQATVLTVDDNETLRYSIRRMLVEAGFNVIEAKTGREALELAATLPDLITLDVNLPDIDGFQVCQNLKANPRTKHIPVLHLSSTFVDPDSRVQGLNGGADAYLAEPIDRAELVATVEALLRTKRSERQAILRAERASFAHEEVRQENLQLEARVRQRTVELEIKSEEIRRLNAHLMKLQDEERRKIARELHDSTGQTLTLLSLNLATLRTEQQLSAEAAKTLSDSAKLTEELTSQLRTVSYLLHPPLLDEVGVASALQWYVQGFTERSRISVALKISEQFGRLEPDLEIAIFRIIQECLTNVHRHSGSQSASVELRRESNQITLEVRDAGSNLGKGATTTPGAGILGMRERVRLLHGQLYVNFEPSGTRVKATIPCPQAASTTATEV